MATPVPTSPLTIREATSPSECGEISALFTSIWGGHQHIPPELGRAIVESGGYVVAARRGDAVVGASVGVVGQLRGQLHLHSHITGVVPDEQRNGVGLALEAASTLVGARARDGSHRLDVRPARAPQRTLQHRPAGARVTRYEIDFYGPVRDAINGEDETDRLVVAWASDGGEGAGPLIADEGLVTVPTPADIVGLRAADPSAAHDARLSLREELGGRMRAGWTVVGLTVEGSYALLAPA